MGAKGTKGSVFEVVTGPFVEHTVGVDSENGTCDAAVSCSVCGDCFSTVESDGTLQLAVSNAKFLLQVAVSLKRSCGKSIP